LERPDRIPIGFQPNFFEGLQLEKYYFSAIFHNNPAIMYFLQQFWLKNVRDLENIAFGGHFGCLRHFNLKFSFV
jgi:hypothetical protein